MSPSLGSHVRTSPNTLLASFFFQARYYLLFFISFWVLYFHPSFPVAFCLFVCKSLKKLNSFCQVYTCCILNNCLSLSGLKSYLGQFGHPNFLMSDLPITSNTPEGRGAFLPPFMQQLAHRNSNINNSSNSLHLSIDFQTLCLTPYNNNQMK